MIIEENFKWHLEAFASELFTYTCELNVAQWPSSLQYANAYLVQRFHQYAD